MIENYNYLIDKYSKEQAGKILNIFDKGEPLSEDIVVEIFKLAAYWAIESSWLRFPEQKPRDSYPCACKPLFPDRSIPNMFIGEFDVEQDAWFILADDSVAIGGRKSGRITSPLIWQPLSLGKEKAWTRVHDRSTGESPYYEDAAIIEAMDRGKEMPEDDIMAKAMKIEASVEARHREEIASSPLDIMVIDVGTDSSLETKGEKIKAEDLTPDQRLSTALRNQDFADGTTKLGTSCGIPKESVEESIISELFKPFRKK